MSWTPAVIQAVISIAVLVAVGLAVLGQVRWRATQEWEALADVRQQRIQSLERDLEFLRTQMTAIEAQLSKVQRDATDRETDMTRLNLELQKRLEKALRGADGGKGQPNDR